LLSEAIDEDGRALSPHYQSTRKSSTQRSLICDSVALAGWRTNCQPSPRSPAGEAAFKHHRTLIGGFERAAKFAGGVSDIIALALMIFWRHKTGVGVNDPEAIASNIDFDREVALI